MIGTGNTSALPGTNSLVFIQPRKVYYGSRPGSPDSYLPLGLIVLDGTKVNNAANAPYTFYTPAGTFVGLASNGKYAACTLGLTTVAYTSGGTTITTDPNTAALIVSRQGSSGTFLVTGPAAAGGTVQPLVSVTFSAVNASTGAITVTSPGVSFAAGSLIQPTDGSVTPSVLITDENGLSCRDATNVNTIDVLVDHPYAAGLLYTPNLINFPAEASTRAWFKAQFRLKCPTAMFTDDFIPGE